MSYKDELPPPIGEEIYGLHRPLFEAPGGLGYIMHARHNEGQVFEVYSKMGSSLLAMLSDFSATLITECSWPGDETLKTDILPGLTLAGARRGRQTLASPDVRTIQDGYTLRLRRPERLGALIVAVRSAWFDYR